MLRWRGDDDGALEALGAARALYREARHPLGEGYARLGEAEVFLGRRAREPALVGYREVRRLSEAADDGVGQSETWRGEAEALLAAGKPAEAAAAAERGVKLEASRGEQDTEIRALLTQAEARARLGAIGPAVELLERAIQRFGDRRAGFVADVQRTGQESLISPAYHLLIPALWRLGKPAEALLRSEEARSQVLLDLLSSRQGPGLERGPPPLPRARRSRPDLGGLGIGRGRPMKRSFEMNPIKNAALRIVCATNF